MKAAAISIIVLVLVTFGFVSAAKAQTSQDASFSVTPQTGCPFGTKGKPIENKKQDKPSDFNKTDCLSGEDGVTCYRRVHGIK